VGKIRARYLNNPLLGLESFVDDPEGADPLSSLHRAHVDLAIGPNHPYLVLALEVLDSPLGHEERSSLHAGGGPDLRVLARTQDISWIRELAPGAEGARRHANLAVYNDQFAPVGINGAVGEDDLDGDVLHPRGGASTNASTVVFPTKPRSRAQLRPGNTSAIRGKRLLIGACLSPMRV